MEIKTEIKISRDELSDLIRKHYQVDGDITFVVTEDTYRSGYCDEGNIYSTRHIFEGVKITIGK